MRRNLLALGVGEEGIIVDILSTKYFEILRKGLDIGMEIVVVDKYEDAFSGYITKVKVLPGQVIELNETEAACIFVEVKRLVRPFWKPWLLRRPFCWLSWPLNWSR